MHNQKFHGTGGGLERHCKRVACEHRNNPNIDPTRTHLNFNLTTEHNMTVGQFIHQRMQVAEHKKNCDLVTHFSWVITLPKDFWERNKIPENEPQKRQEEIRKFFQSAQDFFDSKYGAENRILSTVHLDETTPHMHAMYTPVVTEIKKTKLHQRERTFFNAKKLINRANLREMHPQAEQFISQKLGYKIQLVDPDKVLQNHISMVEYRLKKKAEYLDAIKEEQKTLILQIENGKTALDEITSAIGAGSEKKDQIEKDIERIKKQIENSAENISRNEQICRTLEDYETALKKELSALKKEQDDGKKELKNIEYKIEDEQDNLKRLTDEIKRAESDKETAQNEQKKAYDRAMKYDAEYQHKMKIIDANIPPENALYSLIETARSGRLGGVVLDNQNLDNYVQIIKNCYRKQEDQNIQNIRLQNENEYLKKTASEYKSANENKAKKCDTFDQIKEYILERKIPLPYELVSAFKSETPDLVRKENDNLREQKRQEKRVRERSKNNGRTM